MNAPTSVFTPAYAKLNLTLAVLGRRDDGYHRLASVMQTISLCDTLRFETGAQGEQAGEPSGERAGAGEGALTLDCDVAALATRENLVWRAADLLRREVRRPDLGARIELRKAVPAQGGLGGGSGDAATTLAALNALWGLGLPEGRLLALAGRLGSDTPYLALGGTARIEGRGEIVEPLPDAEPLWLLLALPPTPISTAAVFGALGPGDYGDPAAIEAHEAVVAAIRAGRALPFERLVNTLAAPVAHAYPAVPRVRERLVALGAPLVLMSGSGPTLWAPFRALGAAAALYHRARAEGMRVWLCHTVTRGQVVASRPAAREPAGQAR